MLLSGLHIGTLVLHFLLYLLLAIFTREALAMREY